MDERQRFRKDQNLLVTMGSALRFFAAWTFFKVFLIFTLQPSVLTDLLDPETKGELSDDVMLIAEVITLMILALYVLILLFVANCAVDEGRQKKRHGIYMPLLFMEIVFSLGNLYMEIDPSNSLDWMDFITNLVTDTAMLVVLVQMFRITLSLRRYEKQNVQVK